MLFALRTAATTNLKSPFKNVYGRKPNTVKSLLTQKPKVCLEQDDAIQLEPEEFPKDNDSIVFSRHKTKGTKLEGQFRKTDTKITHSTQHTAHGDNGNKTGHKTNRLKTRHSKRTKQ